MASTLEKRVEKKVVNVIAAFAQVSASSLSRDTRLTYDLGFTKTDKSWLAKPFTRISQAEGGKRVTRANCEELSTVGQSIDLVTKQAKDNGESK